MSYTLQHFALIFVVLMVCLSFTFAPLFGPPVDPPPGTVNDCLGWLKWYGFEDTDMENNRKLAQGRNREHDKEVYKYATLYAQLICSFNARDDLLPSDFCSKYAPEDIMPFEKFKTFEGNCITWLNIYGFTEEDIRYGGKKPEISHWTRIMKRNPVEDMYISIWASLFARFLGHTRDPTNITDAVPIFCLAMTGRTEDGRSWPYMTYDEQLTCEDWLYFAGYSNIIDHNKKVANITPIDRILTIFKNSWAQKYESYIRDESSSSSISTDTTHGDKMKPREFCSKNTPNANKLYGYYN